MSEVEINVHIGEIKIAKRGEILKAILGSCVGIGFIWKKRGMSGLAHCLLAEAPERTFNVSGKYVDQAVPSLMALMRIHPEDVGEIEVVLTGGGNMTRRGATNVEGLVGSNNFAVAERELRKQGFRLVCVDRAGEEGRRIIIHSAEGSYRVEPIPHIGETN